MTNASPASGTIRTANPVSVADEPKHAISRRVPVWPVAITRLDRTVNAAWMGIMATRDRVVECPVALVPVLAASTVAYSMRRPATWILLHKMWSVAAMSDIPVPNASAVMKASLEILWWLVRTMNGSVDN